MNFRRSSAYKQYQQRGFQMSVHGKDTKQNMFRRPRSLKRKSSNRSLNGSITSTSSRSKMDTKLTNQDSVKSKSSSKKDQEQANSNRSETRNFQIDSTAKLLLSSNKSCCSISLLYFSYFTAIYALTAYGITSLLSIYELVMHSNQNYVPLYILVIGYITITLMSVNLLIAIHKDYISIILCWIVTLSVFILPEIALNIVLCETVLGWFNTTTGLYMTVMLIIRVIVDIPCIALVLLYYINRTKRENHLKQILKPIKQEIKNGEILKRYEEIRIDQKMNGSVKDDKNYLFINGKSSNKQKAETLLNDHNHQMNCVNDRNNDENNNNYEPKIYHFTPNNKSVGYLKPKEDALDYVGSNKESKQATQTTIINESLDNKKSLYVTSNQSFTQQQQQQAQANQSIKSFKNSVIYDSSVNTKLLSQKTIQNESPLLCSTNIDDDMIQINYNNIDNFKDVSNKSLSKQQHHVSIDMDNNPPTKRIPNLTSYYMYLPPPPPPSSSSAISKHDSDFQLYNPNEDIDDHTVLAKIGTSCNCVNITSCASNDPIPNQIIHSTNCVYYKP